MAHRKIDVDNIANLDDDEQGYVLEEASIPFDVQESQYRDRTSTVRSELSKSNVQAALFAALSNPPSGHSLELESLHSKSTQTLYEVLSAVKPNDIPLLVKSLDSSQIDLLFKYIYRAMATPETFNSSILLAWHEKVFEVGGHGSIVRVLTDRRVL